MSLNYHARNKSHGCLVPAGRIGRLFTQTLVVFGQCGLRDVPDSRAGALKLMKPCHGFKKRCHGLINAFSIFIKPCHVSINASRVFIKPCHVSINVFRLFIKPCHFLMKDYRIFIKPCHDFKKRCHVLTNAFYKMIMPFQHIFPFPALCPRMDIKIK